MQHLQQRSAAAAMSFIHVGGGRGEGRGGGCSVALRICTHTTSGMTTRFFFGFSLHVTRVFECRSGHYNNKAVPHLYLKNDNLGAPSLATGQITLTTFTVVLTVRWSKIVDGVPLYRSGRCVACECWTRTYGCNSYHQHGKKQVYVKAIFG